MTAQEPIVPILVVDDDAGMRMSIEEVLTNDTRRLILADSGESALRALRRDPDTPAAILLDVNLGGMSGLDTARLIRGNNRLKTIPIVFMTGMSTDDPIMDEAYNLGAVDYLIKPIVPAILESKVSALCDLYRQRVIIENQRDTLAAAQAELAAANERLRELATTDPLTGLANRAGFTEALAAAQARQERRDEPYAIALLDLDRFKAVNDQYGHASGDRVLTTAATRIRNCIRPYDTPARLGGDEFCILFAHVGTGRDLLGLAQRLHAELAEPHQINDSTQAHTPASIGIAECPAENGERIDAETVLKRADRAMYAAKTLKTGYRMYDAALGD